MKEKIAENLKKIDFVKMNEIFKKLTVKNWKKKK